MTEKSNEENQIPEFKQIIARYNDEELRKVLKKRNLYQKEAADFAVDEAIKRGLIFSEQDLFAPEFLPEPEKFSLFPVIENEKARTKFRKSIIRSLIFLGVLPLVWGGITIFKTQNIEGILIFLFGVAWILVSLKLMQSENKNLINLLFVLLIMVIGYFVKIFVTMNYIKWIDVIFSAIAIGFIAYGIGFVGRLKK